MLKPVAGIVVCFACLCAHGAVAETSAVSDARGERLFVGVTDVCRTPEDVQVQRFYIEALAAAGHVPVVVPKVADPGVYEDIVKRLDVLLLTGGEDVEPARYGAAKSPACGNVNEQRDAFEFALLDAAKARRLPIFGICRGVQMLNVYFGGTLWQDLPSEFPVADGVKKLHFKGAFPRPYAGAATNPPAHSVSAVAGSRLASIVGTEPLLVNSHHHQAVQKVAPGFRISAFAPDGVPEAIEGDSYPAAGLQFHPEAILAASKDPQFDRERLMRIFARLGELVSVYGIILRQ